MKKNLLPWQFLTLVVLVLPSIYLLKVWPALPDQVPSHFGLDGQANGYTSRNQLWLLTLALPLGVALLFAVLPRLDPKHRLDGDSVNFQKLRLAVVALLGGLACYVLYLAMHPGTPPGRGLAVLLGLFFAFLGNYLTTVQPNYFVGIRTPWTLESPAVWARTHRVGGILFCVSGLLLAGLAFVLPPTWIEPVLLVFILGTAGFSYAYSYVVFREEARLNKPA
ncbi:SdpI family protein [Hymenobacter terricola]|uniref:SdpI family protein n=1 Tax=Hymenobacter terricola TaxID=2819236 RepID=UPI001B312B7B|nr:SdpI family protein [Hymenobacter terricola]